MIEAVLILTIALLPPLASLLLMRRQQQRATARLQTALAAATVQSFQRLHHTLSADYGQARGCFLVGDPTCRFNAHSAFLRCAVNPSGSCQECPYYEADDRAAAAVARSSIGPVNPNL